MSETTAHRPKRTKYAENDILDNQASASPSTNTDLAIIFSDKLHAEHGFVRPNKRMAYWDLGFLLGERSQAVPMVESTKIYNRIKQIASSSRTDMGEEQINDSSM